MGRLDDKVCIITGTGGSMGRAAALMFSENGAKVVGCDINPEQDRLTAEMVRERGGEMISLAPCDLTDPASCEKLAELCIETHGRIDVLFNNAAMAYFGWIDELSLTDWNRTINEDLNLVFFMTQASWEELKNTSGTIINMASAVAWNSFKVLPGIAHTAAKGGVLSMTRQMAMEGAKYGIRANTISPGVIETNQTVPLLEDPEWTKSMLDKVMLSRLGKPHEVAAVALFLASDESSFITGADIRVDGGMTAW